MRIWGSFPGVNRPVREVHRSLPFSTEIKNETELYHYSPPYALMTNTGRTLLACYLTKEGMVKTYEITVLRKIRR